jgi:hypothetical protein
LPHITQGGIVLRVDARPAGILGLLIERIADDLQPGVVRCPSPVRLVTAG